MTESYITSKILKYLKSLDGMFCWKVYSGGYASAGIPDIVCCYNGAFVAFEVKTDSGKPSKLQNVTIKQINNAGGVAAVVRSVEDVQRVLGLNIKT